jgi:hypothetical protein
MKGQKKSFPSGEALLYESMRLQIHHEADLHGPVILFLVGANLELVWSDADMSLAWEQVFGCGAIALVLVVVVAIFLVVS